MAILKHGHSSANRPLPRGKRRSAAAGFVLRSTLMLMLSVVLTLASPPSAKAQRGAELNRLKAAFVFQFTNFVEWPDDAFEDDSSPFLIGVVGNDAVRDILETAVREKLIAGRKPSVRSFSSTGDLSSCQIIFVDESEARNASDIIVRHVDKPILTISDSDSFTKVGGVIRLYRKSSKLRIEINIDAAERADLKISSKLLSLSQVVHDDES